MQEQEQAARLSDLLDRRGPQVLARWVSIQSAGGATMAPAVPEEELRESGETVLDALQMGLRSGQVAEPAGAPYDELRRHLENLSTRRAAAGETPSEVATGVLSLREAVVPELLDEYAGDADLLMELTAAVGRLVDSLALLTFESYVGGRESVISRQSYELLELSTPVVRLWDGIVGVPLIGTLDSNRAAAVMESLLQAIVQEKAGVAILDITGVPTVDTLVAQHLFKTVTATRLMGADCIISGIRPQTAQTIVQLGIDLTGVTTRSTLADALATAIGWVTPDAAGGSGR